MERPQCAALKELAEAVPPQASDVVVFILLSVCSILGFTPPGGQLLRPTKNLACLSLAQTK